MLHGSSVASHHQLHASSVTSVTLRASYDAHPQLRNPYRFDGQCATQKRIFFAFWAVKFFFETRPYKILTNHPYSLKICSNSEL